MSWEDDWTKRQQFMIDKQNENEERKRQIESKPVKDIIKKELDIYLEKTDAPRTKSEETAIVELAYEIKTNRVKSEEKIEEDNRKLINYVESWYKTNLQKYDQYRERVNKQLCQGFFSFVIDCKSEREIISRFDQYLQKENIEIRRSQEKEIIALAIELFKNKISTEDALSKEYKTRIAKANETKNIELKKLKEYSLKMKNEKFSPFLKQYVDV